MSAFGRSGFMQLCHAQIVCSLSVYVWHYQLLNFTQYVVCVCGLKLDLQPGGRLQLQIRRFSESSKIIRLTLIYVNEHKLEI